jgi:hypothetical protein
MAQRRFPIIRSVLTGVLVVALGTAVGLGVQSAAARARGRSALALVGATSPKALLEVRASEQARLEQGPLPIERAMDQLASRGRRGAGPALEPLPSDDLAPMQGWGMKPHDVAPWMMVDAGAAPAPSR